MTRDEIVGAISALTDEDTILGVLKAAKERAGWASGERLKRKRAERDALDRETMQSIKGWKPGTVVYFGKPWNRGHMWMNPMKIIHVYVDAGFKATVHSVQPRARRVWLKLPGKKTAYRDNLMPFDASDIRQAEISRTEIAIRQSA